MANSVCVKLNIKCECAKNKLIAAANVRCYVRLQKKQQWRAHASFVRAAAPNVSDATSTLSTMLFKIIIIIIIITSYRIYLHCYKCVQKHLCGNISTNYGRCTFIKIYTKKILNFFRLG